ncbi:MAG: hypothetical protein P4M05_36665 [Bradyrhizobium sp.]|nr:hypothetical protein [Bradyrhizobium sp.]
MKFIINARYGVVALIWINDVPRFVRRRFQATAREAGELEGHAGRGGVAGSLECKVCSRRYVAGDREDFNQVLEEILAEAEVKE